MIKLICYGAGYWFHEIIKEIDFEQCEIIALADADLYQPILAGLNYFHAGNPVSLVPVSDMFGSVVITK